MKKPSIFYGYWVLAACFIFIAIGAGSTFMSFSFFLTHLNTDMGWSRTAIMGSFTSFTLIMGFAAPLIGRLVDRYGARRVVFVGTVITAGGFAVLSQLSSLWHYYAGYAIIGIGSSAMSHVVSSIKGTYLSLVIGQRRIGVTECWRTSKTECSLNPPIPNPKE